MEKAKHVHATLAGPTVPDQFAVAAGQQITLVCDACGETYPWPSTEVADLNKAFFLHDGTALKLYDWANAPSQGFYSAFIVTPDLPNVGDGALIRWPVFTYARGNTIPGDPSRTATRAHTNVLRAGSSGLPKDWEMLVCKWRATLSQPLVEPVQEWAAETSVEFEYNGKRYGDASLIDLVLQPQPQDPYKLMPVHIRENLNYRAEVQSAEAPTRRLRDWLASSSTPRKCLTAWIHIEGPIRRSVV